MAGTKRWASNPHDSPADAAISQAGVAPSPHEDKGDISPDDGRTAVAGAVKRKKKKRKFGAVTGYGSHHHTPANTLASPSRSHSHGLTTADDGPPLIGPLHQTEPSSRKIDDQTNEAGSQGNNVTPPISLAKLPTQLEHLHEKYSFSLIDIGANSRYEKNMNMVFRLISEFSQAEIYRKPNVVLMAVRAEYATRLVAIVEGVKTLIVADGGKWFQYNGLRGDILNIKPKVKKRRSCGKSLSEGGEERHTTAKEAAVVEETAKNSAEDDVDLDKETFQPMVCEGLDESSARPSPANDKIRSVPIVTIFMARFQVPELASLYWWVKSTALFSN